MTDYTISGPVAEASGPIVIVAKIVRWGRKGGSIRKFGNGHNNSKTKRITVAKMLVEQARSFGYVNGVRIARKK